MWFNTPVSSRINNLCNLPGAVTWRQARGRGLLAGPWQPARRWQKYGPVTQREGGGGG